MAVKYYVKLLHWLLFTAGNNNSEIISCDCAYVLNVLGWTLLQAASVLFAVYVFLADRCNATFSCCDHVPSLSVISLSVCRL